MFIAYELYILNQHRGLAYRLLPRLGLELLLADDGLFHDETTCQLSICIESIHAIQEFELSHIDMDFLNEH